MDSNDERERIEREMRKQGTYIYIALVIHNHYNLTSKYQFQKNYIY
jgi:hypothetical protein